MYHTNEYGIYKEIRTKLILQIKQNLISLIGTMHIVISGLLLNT